MSDVQDLKSTAEPQPGDSFGPYRIESLLGEGGMGRVFKATGPGGTQVALKVVKADLARDSVFRRRFDREAKTAARVEHSHVVPVLDTGEQDGIPYLAQEYIAGGSLSGRIEEEGPLPIEPAVRMLLQVADGLDALHREGLVHRDVKPANILLAEEDSAKLADFGLAKDSQASALTKPGQALGSMDYMSPEQIRGETVSPAADVYSLGCVMFECICGRAPFADRKGMRILWAHLQEDPPDPRSAREDVPQDMSWALLRALEKEAANRPPTATAYARMVQFAARRGP